MMKLGEEESTWVNKSVNDGGKQQAGERGD